MSDANAIANRALAEWANLTGVNPEPMKEGEGRSYTMSGWSADKHTRQLVRSRQLDPSGLTTLMLLRAALHEWAEELTAPLVGLLNPRSRASKQVESARRILAIVDEARAPIDAFLGAILAAATAYGAPAPDLKRLLDDPQIGRTRYEALTAAEDLHVHRFSVGEPDPSDRVRFNPDVVEFARIDDALAAARQHPESGISLVLIRDEEDYNFSFFGFVIRNGENLLFLTDREDDETPFLRYRTRRPDRHLEKRARQYMFPYQLLDVATSVEADKVVRAVAKRRAKAVLPIANLPSLQLAWTVSVLDLLKSKWWNPESWPKEISYTGTAVNLKLSIDGGGDRVLTHYAAPLPPIERQTLDAVDRTAARSRDSKDHSGCNDWMLERHAEAASRAPALRDQHKLIHPLALGPIDVLRADLAYIARQSIATKVMDAAAHEYLHHRNPPINAVEKMLRARRDFFVRAALLGEMQVPTLVQNPKNTFDRAHAATEDIMKWMKPEEKYNAWTVTKFHWRGYCLIQIGGRQVTSEKRTVVITAGADPCGKVVARDGSAPLKCVLAPHRRASVCAVMQPLTAAALAHMCGCPISELPEVFHHWSAVEPYVGNSILDRVDPVDDMKDPWRSVSFCIVVAFSQPALDRKREELGLPALPPLPEEG